MSFAACAIALLCLVSVSHTAPLACEDLVRPLDHFDRHSLHGRWALVAGSVGDPRTEGLLRARDSVVFDYYNSSYTQANRLGGVCKYHPHNISTDTHPFTIKAGNFNFTVTFFNTSCPDCVIFTFAVESHNYKSVDFYLLSRRREVDQREMEEFAAQVKCLNMPPHIVKDPTMELCPQQTSSEAVAQTEEEEADGQKTEET